MVAQREFDEFDFEPDLANDRAARRAEALATAEQLRKDRVVQESAAAQRRQDFGRRANVLALIGEYDLAGVEPPQVDADGVPKHSLAFLRKMGWTIEEAYGQRQLIPPPPR